VGLRGRPDVVNLGRLQTSFCFFVYNICTFTALSHYQHGFFNAFSFRAILPRTRQRLPGRNNPDSNRARNADIGPDRTHAPQFGSRSVSRRGFSPFIALNSSSISFFHTKADTKNPPDRQKRQNRPHPLQPPRLHHRSLPPPRKIHPPNPNPNRLRRRMDPP
jgi:hypothetical protein